MIKDLEANHAYCQLCQKIREVIVRPLDEPSDCGHFVLVGDILCTECDLAIATLYKESAQ